MDDYTSDSLFDGALTLRQPRNGYRFTVDSVLLAHFSSHPTGETVVDLGTGSGIIPLILAYRFPDLTVTGVEIQPGLAALAKKNATINGLDMRIHIIHDDLNRLTTDDFKVQPGCVMSNPPYIPQKNGRLNPMREKALARHEITVDLSRLVSKASELLTPDGRFSVIYPFNRLDELLTELADHGFGPERIRMVHPIKAGPPTRILVESIKGRISCPNVEKPLIIFKSHGIYSDEVEKMYSAGY